jgi:hypothetical protein
MWLWSGFIWLGQGEVTGCFEHANKPLDHISPERLLALQEEV